MREQLDLLEEKLENLSKNEKIALAISLPIALFGLFYFFYLSDAFETKSANERALIKINRNLHKHSQKVLLSKIRVFKKRILETKSAIVQESQKLTYLQTKLVKNHFLSLTQEDFTHFLNNMLAQSVKNNFLIESIDISKESGDFIGKLEYKKRVQVKGSGEFLDTLQFIRDVEESSMLMEIQNITLETNGSTPFVHYEIRFYGVKK